MNKRVVLIGPGRLGQAIGRLLAEAGYDIRAVISRDQGRAVEAARFIGFRHAATTELARAAEGELVLIALPDDQIGEMAATLRRGGHLAAGSVLVHFSGLHPASIMLGEQGPPLGALAIHPLQTFADAVMGVRNLPGSPCSVEGAAELLPLAEQFVEDLGGTPFRIAAECKPLYHAAACFTSNYLVSLVAAACEMLCGCGLEKAEATRLLLPLLTGTCHNLSVLGPEQALTGPIARGDQRTVGKHLQALGQMPADLGEIYRVLGRKTVEVAQRKGTIDPQKAADLLKLLADQ
ncbi:NADP oxidoreductase [Desulfuromonas versatilis]|uniref:NADP oxidoreductase n=1 Tax=Desulfuromonas versatilis TaxID=2802975 RepID=A0ABM8HVD2_9BACT|nr:Rossmann-like and DUF2520 domain-containing protein [Desulfuromonas versatilis]BCR05961.1 NADP oxidoreductase [Desulfuromonas versatilis]